LARQGLGPIPGRCPFSARTLNIRGCLTHPQQGHCADAINAETVMSGGFLNILERIRQNLSTDDFPRFVEVFQDFFEDVRQVQLPPERGLRPMINSGNMTIHQVLARIPAQWWASLFLIAACTLFEIILFQATFLALLTLTSLVYLGQELS
jgi:hypothetical protein